MPERPSEYARDADDWYVEHPDVVRALYYTLLDSGGWPYGPVHDPCCGSGNIVDTLGGMGLHATGADLVDRSSGRFPVRDFLADTASYANICCNPPFKIAAKIVGHALGAVEPGGIIAIVAQAKFLYSQGRYQLFQRRDMDCVIHLSRRPSMPPGKLLAEKGEACRGGGSMDYCWAVWRLGRKPGPAVVRWAL